VAYRRSVSGRITVPVPTDLSCASPSARQQVMQGALDLICMDRAAG
jgi:hypothetical protein